MIPSRRLQELQDVHGPEAGGIIYRQETENHRLRQRVEELEDEIERLNSQAAVVPAGLVEEPADADEKAVG